MSHYDYEGTGLFMTYLSCDPERAGENLQQLLNLFRQAEERGVTPAELEQAKNKINSRVVLSSERPRGRLFNLGANWTHRRQYRSVQDDLTSVDAVTLEQLTEVLRKYPLSVSTTVAIGPRADIAAPV